MLTTHRTAARIEDDPVTAEYDVYLTNPTQAYQIFLLQYPNRPRDKPFNARLGALPREMRIKPQSGHLEVDVNLNTDHNFNKYRGLQWGDALQTGKEVQNASATYGMAAGFTGARGGVVGPGGRRVQMRDDVDRERTITDGLIDFDNAEVEGKVFHKQTVGGQIMRHDGPEDAGKPMYFVGAFRGSELHLTRVSGTAQMRPQFHHLDAEHQRKRIANSRAAAAAAADSDASAHGPEVARVIHQTYKPTTNNPKGELEQREFEMRTALQTAHAEQWTKLKYVDEDEEDAFNTWNDKMFLQNTSEEGGCARLKSSMANDEFLDAISAPSKDGTTKKRRKGKRGKGSEAMDVDVDDGEETAAGEA